MVCRVNKNKNYTVMCNHHLQNKSLSLKAKGLLSQILSLPEEWDYTIEGLARINNDGVAAISTAIKELEKEGYVIRHRERNSHGCLGKMIYDIYEIPQNSSDDKDNTETMNTETEVKGKNNSSVKKESDTTAEENNKCNNVYNNEDYQPPSRKEVVDYFKKEKLTQIDPIDFFNYYSEVGWKNKLGNLIDWKKTAKYNHNIRLTTNQQENNNCKDSSKSSYYHPPKDLEEVVEFFKETGLTRLDPAEFYHYYSSVNWKNKSGKPINWKETAIYRHKQKEEIKVNETAVRNDKHKQQEFNFEKRNFEPEDLNYLEGELLAGTFKEYDKKKEALREST